MEAPDNDRTLCHSRNYHSSLADEWSASAMSTTRGLLIHAPHAPTKPQSSAVAPLQPAAAPALCPSYDGLARRLIRLHEGESTPLPP